MFFCLNKILNMAIRQDPRIRLVLECKNIFDEVEQMIPAYNEYTRIFNSQIHLMSTDAIEQFLADSAKFIELYNYCITINGNFSKRYPTDMSKMVKSVQNMFVQQLQASYDVLFDVRNQMNVLLHNMRTAPPQMYL